MPSFPDRRGHYVLDFSDAVAENLKRLQRQASRRGQGQLFAAAFRRIVRALRKNPTIVGELLYRLPVLRLEMRTVVMAPLVIDFAVSDERPIVYITSGKLLSLG
jgi:hypothetical protein